MNAVHHRKRNRATAAVKPVIFHAIAPLQALQEAWAADTLQAAAAAEEEARSATSAVKSATSLGTAPKAALEAMEEEEEAMVAEQEVMVADMEPDVPSKPATPAAVMDTCLATVPKARSATIVGFSSTRFFFAS